MTRNRVLVAILVTGALAAPSRASVADYHHVHITAASPLQAVDWYAWHIGCEPVTDRSDAANCYGVEVVFVSQTTTGSKYPPAKPGALVVSRSKRQDVAATRHLSHPTGGCSHPTGAALAVGLPVPAPGYTRESLAHPDPAWTRSSLEPRSAARQNCATARQTPERCRSRSCP